MFNLNSSIYITGILSSVLTLGSCSSSSSNAPVANKNKSATSSVEVAAPKPPQNQFTGAGFGLSDPSQEQLQLGTESTATTTTSTTIPKGAVAAQGGGYWATPSDQSIAKSNPGYMQYYDSNGVSSEWFGQKSGSNNFTMVKYDNQGTLDMSKQFVAQNQNGSWTGGQILGSNGQPYQIAGASKGQSIVSQGFTYGQNGNAVYNWQATNPSGVLATGAETKSFQTTAFDLTQGFTKGLAFMPMGKSGVKSGIPEGMTPNMYQPNMVSTVAPIAGFFSTLFGN